MISIYFSNKYGNVFFGGTNKCTSFRIKEIVGLGLPGSTLNTINYAGQEGRETLSSLRNYRTITIKGDIEGENKDYEIRKAIKVFSVPVEMELSVNGRIRKCNCRCTSFDSPFGKKHFKEFIVQFECDSPYFQDKLITKESIYREEKILPFNYKEYFGENKKMISELISESIVYNQGDVIAEPIITIINTGKTSDKTSGVTIYNSTTGKEICLEYATKEGETITIDISERKIYSSTGENLINHLKDDSYLSDFFLEEGPNILGIKTNVSESIISYCSFYNQYLEAMD